MNAVEWISIILLAIAVSFDSLAIGMTYGMAKIKIPSLPKLVLSIVSGCFLLIAMLFSRLAFGWITPQMANLVGGSILILIGFYNLWRVNNSHQKSNERVYQPLATTKLVYKLRIPFLGLIINVIKEPLSADYDQSKTISINEGLILGLALSLDAFASGIGAAVLGFPPLITALAVMVASYVFISQGLKHGLRLQSNFNLKWLPSLIIILIGVIKIFI